MRRGAEDGREREEGRGRRRRWCLSTLIVSAAEAHNIDTVDCR